MQRVRSRLGASRMASFLSGPRGGWPVAAVVRWLGKGSGLPAAWCERGHTCSWNRQQPRACSRRGVPAWHLRAGRGDTDETTARRTLVAARSNRVASWRKRRRRDMWAGYGRNAAAPRPATACGMKPAFNFPVTPGGCRRCLITLATCKMQRREAVRIMGGSSGTAGVRQCSGERRHQPFHATPGVGGWTVFQIPSAPRVASIRPIPLLRTRLRASSRETSSS